MTMAQEHLRFAAIARQRGDPAQWQKHLELAEAAQEECDLGNCRCATRCKPIGNGFNGWGKPLKPFAAEAEDKCPHCLTSRRPCYCEKRPSSSEGRDA